MAELKRTALELGEPQPQLSLAARAQLGRGHRRAQLGQLGRRSLLGLVQLALGALQTLGQLTGVVLACAQTAGEAVDLGTAVALSARATILGLDAQLLLGVLTLLDTTQLVLTLCHGRLFGGEPLSEDRSLLGGLTHPLLKA